MRIALIGGGPAGLMAAQVLGQGELFEAMPTVGRKFLLAGRGGLNLTHSEPWPDFLSRYRESAPWLEPHLQAFGPQDVVRWCEGLGFETFVGSSQRVFPRSMKAAPLLRTWLSRLPITFHTRHRWTGWNEHGELCFETPHGVRTVRADATLLALGGASWPRMGSTGAWVPWLRERGIAVPTWQAANVGYEVAWSPLFRQRFEGQPLKSVALTVSGRSRQGELMITSYGLEGSLLYPFGPDLRGRLPCAVHLDLLPHTPLDRLQAALDTPRGSRSWAKFLRQKTGLHGPKLGLAYEFLGAPPFRAEQLKAIALPLLRPRPLDEAISSAGGVALEELDDNLMLTRLPGVFCAGEMLDWEAPTGGYLLTACLATGYAAGQGMLRYLQSLSPDRALLADNS